MAQPLSSSKSGTQTSSEIVSSEREPLILVDSDDRELGWLDKSAAHDGNGMLHRAFSLFIFNGAGELLIQQRAPGKRLWPSFWSNSCCSHPRAREDMSEAVGRRLQQELGMQAELHFVYKFEYVAHYKNLGTEHELCSVYIGRSNDQPVINATEIQAWRWIPPVELTRELAEHGDRFTPWLKLEWEYLRQQFGDDMTGIDQVGTKE